MTILEQLREITEEICDNYCKYGEKIHYAVTVEDLDKLTEPCENCPLCRIE